MLQGVPKQPILKIVLLEVPGKGTIKHLNYPKKKQFSLMN